MKWVTFLFVTIPLLIQRYAERYEERDLMKTLKNVQDDGGVARIEIFDYIIIGGGTAGCLLAGRLSEKFTVLLIEAGGNPVPMTQTPYYTGTVSRNSKINYLFQSVPQKKAALKANGIISIYNGKMLGGSGSHNEMIYFRGNPLDWNSIASVLNDESFNYTNIVKHYKNVEKFVGRLVNEEEAGNFATRGSMIVDSDFPATSSLWFAAGRELGFVIKDPNTIDQGESFYPLHKLISRGQRVSTYNAYIKHHWKKRTNLKIVRYAYANEVLIDSESKKVYGVAYTRHGMIPGIAHASKEIIISCGAFSSPLLLMRSGVGPADMLQDAGITLKVNSTEVGKNLADHVYILLDQIQLNSSASAYMTQINDDNAEKILKQYDENGEGLLGELNVGPEASLVSKRAKQKGEYNWPDSKLTLFTKCPQPADPINSTDKIQWCLIVTLVRPKSTGNIGINVTEYRSGSVDDTKLAVVDFNTFGDPSDEDVIVDAIESGLAIFEKTISFQNLGVKYVKPPVPECKQFLFRSREYWRCYIKTFTGPGNHMTGTCSMGGVVDNNMKVKGVQGLRVVDASVFPFIPSVNIAGPVIAVAEKIAADILSQH